MPRMAMGTRENEQPPLWVATSDLPSSPGHPFYTRLNAVLEAEDFDRFVEDQCRRFYAPVMGRPGLEPGRYFRLLLIGYFEGIDSERGIAWRAADSLGVRRFPAIGPRGRGTRSLDDLAHAPADRSRNASRRLHVGSTAAGDGGAAETSNDRDRRDDPGSECRVVLYRSTRH